MDLETSSGARKNLKRRFDADREPLPRLASLPGKALSLTKRLLNESLERSLTDQLQAEAFAQETAGRTKDHFEGVTAFLQKRTPEFVGE